MNDPAFEWMEIRLREAVDSLDRATTWLLGHVDKAPEAALAGATPYLKLFGYAAGGAMLADEALATVRDGRDGAEGPAARIAIARFFAQNLAVAAPGLERAVIDGAESITGADAALMDA
jgi:acyl-CoA dehydrogenase